MLACSSANSGIFSFHPLWMSHAFAGKEVKNPAIIAICIMYQKTAMLGFR
jgi:hypothetical protein